MPEIRFTSVVGEDRTIHLPADFPLPSGEVEVTVRPRDEPEAPAADTFASTRAWLLKMADKAEALAADDPSDLPADLAENHDHYAHGKPRS